MPAIYHPGVVATVPHYNIGAPHVAANVLYWYTGVNPLSSNQLTTIQTTFDTAWLSLWRAGACQQCAYAGSTVTDMSNSLGAQVDNSLYSPASGTIAGNPVGDATSLLLSLKGRQRYRGGHSRLYLPGMAESETLLDGRTWAQALITAMNSQWASLVLAMNGISSAGGGPLKPIIWHKHWTAQPNSVEDIVGIVPQPVFATQRRRLRKVARHKKKTP